VSIEPMRVMIVDDEAPAREGLRLRLRNEPGVTIVGEFGDVRRALETLRADVPDVLLLDIEMPAANGFSLVEQLGDRCPIVIFVTAHEIHALRAFGVQALDYVLKPVDQQRLRQALDRARERLALERKSELADRVRRLVADEGSPAVAQTAVSAGERFAVRDDGVIRFIDYRDVDWIEAAGDGVLLHVGRASHQVRRSLSEVTAMLPRDRFLRIHRSTVVNIARVRELQPWFHGEYIVVLHDGTNLKLSRTHRDALKRLSS
jgi:two-component system LytT family response regulator